MNKNFKSKYSFVLTFYFYTDLKGLVKILMQNPAIAPRHKPSVPSGKSGTGWNYCDFGVQMVFTCKRSCKIMFLDLYVFLKLH